MSLVRSLRRRSFTLSALAMLAVPLLTLTASAAQPFGQVTSPSRSVQETALAQKLAVADALRGEALTSIAQADETHLRRMVKADTEAEDQLDHMILERIGAYVKETFATLSLENPGQDLSVLAQAKTDYESAVKNFGGPKDFLRFNALHRYQGLLNKMTKSSPSLKAKFSLASLRQSVGLLGPFAKLTFRTLVPEMDDDHGTPLAKAADQYFERLRELKNITVKIEGRPLLQKPQAANEINLIVSNHVSAERDAMVLSALNLDSYITFGALNLEGEGIFSIAMHPLMKPVMKKIDAQRDVILLGRHSDPIARLVEVLKSGRTQNLFLFPQGMISLGFNEVNPLKPAFSEKIIQRLQAEGLKVNLQIMTMPDNDVDPTVLVSAPSVGAGAKNLSLRVYLEESIQDTELRRLLSAVGADGMDTLIRAEWIHRLRSYDSDYLGLISEAGLQKRIQRLSCKQTLNN